jgi:hypothetical protein
MTHMCHGSPFSQLDRCENHHVATVTVVVVVAAAVVAAVVHASLFDYYVHRSDFQTGSL